MSTPQSQTESLPPGRSFSFSAMLLPLLGLAVLDAMALWFVYALVSLGDVLGIYLASAVVIITIGLNVIFLKEDLYPFRWLSPGLALMIFLTVYPVLFTVFLSFTNYGTGHLLPKETAIAQLQRVTYAPEGASSYTYTAFRSAEGQYLLWVVSSDGDSTLVAPGQVLEPASINAGPLDENGIPASIPGHQRLSSLQLLPYLSELEKLEFGEPPTTLRITSSTAASASLSRYEYDPQSDTITDQLTGTVYTPVNGTFTSADGQRLNPGFITTVGFHNYLRLFASPAFAGPFFLIFIWTVVYSLLSVLLTFALGLFLAIVYNDDSLSERLRKLLRSLLIVPYSIPAFIGVQVWVAMLNPQYGVVNRYISAIFGTAPAWFADPFWAKAGVLLVQLWLGFPYMMLICTGALQSIPKDLYQAAQVDGASVWSQFRSITLPLILLAVSPLLVASFAFNFNNFTVIDIYNRGGPPMANSPTPAGHTDILISYTFRLAFGSGGSDYGYASAITVIIFVVLSVLTYFQFRRTQQTAEV
ncbi:MAG: maltose ABC transporter permease MalF [Anaerolineae bacterium]